MSARSRDDGPHEDLDKIEVVVGQNATQGKGFHLTSRYAKTKPARSPMQNASVRAQPAHRMPIVVGSPIGSPVPSRKSTPSRRRRSPAPATPPPAYLTEIEQLGVDMDGSIMERELEELPEAPPATPTATIVDAPLDDVVEEVHQEEQPREQEPEQAPPPTMREEPVGGAGAEQPAEELVSKRKKKKGNRISAASFARLGLAKRPPQYTVELRPFPGFGAGDHDNPPPPATHVYVERVHKTGSFVKTPFYVDLELPEGAIAGDADVKFETQTLENAKLNLRSDDKLCSHVVDVALRPLTYCLQREATVRMRILKECICRHEEVVIIAARHFNWQRVNTTIETKQVDDKLLYYAVTKTQHLSKFAVISARKWDRFVMTNAGGCFPSTVYDRVSMSLAQKSMIKNLSHLVEMSVLETRRDALTHVCRDVPRVQGVSGTLIAATPLVSVTKQTMGRTGLCEHGTTLPNAIGVELPVTAFNYNPAARQPRPEVRVMHRATTDAVVDERGEHLPADAGTSWRDITADQKDFMTPRAAELESGGAVIMMSAPAPGDFLALVFDADQAAPGAGAERELSEVCELLLQANNCFDATLLVHQKAAAPNIISIHVVPAEAADIINDAMVEQGAWCEVGGRATCRLNERDAIDLQFRDGVRPTVNQLPPRVELNTRRWQGYLFQLEATADAYSEAEAEVRGTVGFMLPPDDEGRTRELHSVHLAVPRQLAKPYQPTVVVRPLPKVTVIREYKQKWMESLSGAEQAKYSAISAS